MGRIENLDFIPIFYLVVIESGVGTTTGGRRNVRTRLMANNVTAVSSFSAEPGRTFQAQAA
jgi:hypothetical protein